MQSKTHLDSILKNSSLACLLLIANFVLGNCKVPTQLEGVNLIYTVDPMWSSSNPNAGATFQLQFDKTHYFNKQINGKKYFSGEYTYEVLDKENGIGLYTGYEFSPQKKPAHTILFKCLDNHYGKAIFTQLEGENETEPRQNSATYSIISSL